MTLVTISLSGSRADFIDPQVAAKGCRDVSEYLRSLLQEAHANERDVRREALLLEGLASRRIPLDARFRQGLGSKVEWIVKKYQARM
jgi:Arc/MetJ-type ribon-helix-helix transcriptional regulator